MEAITSVALCGADHDLQDLISGVPVQIWLQRIGAQREHQVYQAAQEGSPKGPDDVLAQADSFETRVYDVD